MYKKLISFDFDSTLVHTPTPELGVGEWEKYTGLSWQGRGWWGNPESLNLNVFYPSLNQWVYNKYLEYIKDPSNYVFVATGRIKRLEKQVQKVLDLHDIDCDLYCCTGKGTLNFKIDLFESLMEKYPSADELIMFDDRQDHLHHFCDWAKYQKKKITIIDVVNKKQL